MEHYPVKEIEKVVWRATQSTIRLLKDTGAKVEKRSKENMKSYAEQGKALSKAIQQWKSEKLLQYELYADGVLSKDAYMKVKEELTKKIENAEQQLSQAIEKHSEQKELSETVEHLGGLAKSFFSETELTYEIAQSFIQNVYVYKKDRIEIEFRFEDEIKKLIDCSEQGPHEPEAMMEA